MCILFVHTDPCPKEGGYRLIIATNRDEYFHRPALDAQWFEDGTILGGKDMESGREGGMWFGFTTKELGNGEGKKYCVAALLNITGDKIENGGARGRIVRDYLETTLDFHQYIKTLEPIKFSGFNLVAIEISAGDAHIYHYSNTPKIISIYSGKQTVGFGNSPIYTPLSKVSKGRYKFEEIITTDFNNNEELVDALLRLLKDDTRYLPDEELEKRNPAAYVFLSSIFVNIKEPAYGTRAHSIILIDYDWNLHFVEHALKQPIEIENPNWNIKKIISRL